MQINDKSQKLPRKNPKQERSQSLVDTILTAATRVLERAGFDKFSTNKIAEVAGVSIGSLYQYFPNKDALIGALIEKCSAESLNRFEARLTEVRDLPGEEIVDALVRTALESVISNRTILRLIATHTFEVERVGTVIEYRKKMMDLAMEELRAPRHRLNWTEEQAQIRCYAMTCALGGFVEAMLFGEELDQTSLENMTDEAVRMIKSYIRAAH